MIHGIVAQAATGTSGAPTERWWRVRFPVNNDGSNDMTASNPYCDIRFISMATSNGGTNLVPSYVDHKQSIGDALNAVVDNTSLWNNAGNGPLAVDMWAAFKLPTADNIEEVKIRCHSGSSNYSPFIVIVESSYDGVNWNFEFGQARLSWGSAELKTFQRSTLAFVPGAYSRWLLQPYHTTGRANLGIFEMEMATAIGGADQCTGGTPGSTNNGTFPASNLTDDNVGSLCGSTGQARFAHVNYDWGAGNFIDIVETRLLKCVNGEQPDWGAICVTDGTRWIVVQEFLGIPNQGGATTTIRMLSDRDLKKSDSSAHRYWRVRAANTGNLGYTATYSCAKLDFRASGSTLIGGGTPISSTENSGSYINDYAFDGDTATLWASGGSDGTFQWIGYDFGSAVLPDEVVLQTRNDATYWSQMFRIIAVDWSDDGIVWYEKECFEVTGIAGALDEQSFALAA